jgi:threonine dehydrogenase-like Zn-dependent dehydrogenase
MKTRIAAGVTGKGEVLAREVAFAPLKPNEARIKVHASLISPGTEMNLVKIRRATPDPKVDFTVFGYANAGEVIEVNGDCKEFKPGMRVFCMGGGGANHANYANVPVNMMVPLPDNVTYEQAVYACLGATSLQAIHRTHVELGEYGMVLGLGIVGNLAAQLAQLSGARVLAWEAMPSRLKTAARCKIKNTVNFKKADPVKASREFAAPHGMDFAVIAFGGEATAAFDQVKDSMKVSSDTHQMGRVTLVGGCKINIVGGAGCGNLDILSSARTGPGYYDKAWEYGQDFPNAFIQFHTNRNLREIIALIAEKRLLVDPMTTHKIPLAEVGSAAELLINTPDKAMGIVLEMSH